MVRSKAQQSSETDEVEAALQIATSCCIAPNSQPRLLFYYLNTLRAQVQHGSAGSWPLDVAIGHPCRLS